MSIRCTVFVFMYSQLWRSAKAGTTSVGWLGIICYRPGTGLDFLGWRPIIIFRRLSFATRSRFSMFFSCNNWGLRANLPARDRGDRSWLCLKCRMIRISEPVTKWDRWAVHQDDGAQYINRDRIFLAWALCQSQRTIRCGMISLLWNDTEMSWM